MTKEFKNLLDLIHSPNKENHALFFVLLPNFDNELYDNFGFCYKAFEQLYKTNSLIHKETWGFVTQGAFNQWLLVNKKSFSRRNKKKLFLYLTISLETLADKYFDKMYDKKLPDIFNTSAGWLKLKEMVKYNIAPTEDNLRYFHPNLRTYIQNNWSYIRTRKIENE